MLLDVKGEATENGYETTKVTPYVAIAEMVRGQPHASENSSGLTVSDETPSWNVPSELPEGKTYECLEVNPPIDI